ncbi:MAG: YfcE family phosphodiesterase [Clostridia bacterium]|nr:YfcE family phosphodiesterase [Clostridia bacterium]
MTKRLIAVSDSHGSVETLKAAFEQAMRHGSVDTAVFLGDGMRDFEQIKPMLAAARTDFFAVKGNNDWSATEGSEAVFSFSGVRIFICHGHNQHVKYGLEQLWFSARERDAQVALYGHTHQASLDYDQGIYLINPGAVYMRHKLRAAYAELLVTDKGDITARLVNWED